MNNPEKWKKQEGKKRKIIKKNLKNENRKDRKMGGKEKKRVELWKIRGNAREALRKHKEIKGKVSHH